MTASPDARKLLTADSSRIFPLMNVAILTISTSAALGERADVSGGIIAEWAAGRGYQLRARALVPDDALAIGRQLMGWCDSEAVDLVLTTGGTGLSPTDVTPEATRAVLEREAPGIAELLRNRAIGSFPRAALSRGLAGVRHRTLVLNLPGSPGGVRDGLAALEAIVDHAVAVVSGAARHHDDPA